MRLLLLSIACFVAPFSLLSQKNQAPNFQAAYQTYPSLTPGVLEAVSWTNTHFVHLANYDASCSGLPQAYGIMGMYDQGQGYFIENGKIIAKYSGISVEVQKNSAADQIMAYAHAYDHLMNAEIANGGNKTDGKSIQNVLNQLTEIPDSGIVNLLARDLDSYEVFSYIKSAENALKYGFSQSSVSLQSLYGASNYAVLSSDKIVFTETSIKSDKGVRYEHPMAKSIEYGPAIWNPAPICNFSSRSGTAISAITIHTIQGSYSGAISWSQNCVSNVSFHYVIRSSDGQVTQMVLEADKGWHVGTENPYTIGYEHEGYVSDPSWYTEAMYNSSAALSRDVVGSGYGIPPLRTYYGPSSSVTDILGGCTKIKGHQHYPNQTHTDPGINWNWEKYYKLINNLPIYTVVNTASGNLYDTGGLGGSYQDDERELWLIQPPLAQTVTVDFTAFDIEIGYDNLFIYDGDNPDAPLLGVYTGTASPGIISSTGGSLLIEFRSDCGTTAPGWEATFTSATGDINPPLTVIDPDAIWHTDDFTVDFTDSDAESGVEANYYLIAHQNVSDNGWKSEDPYGFLHEDFEDNLTSWTNQTGVYALNAGTTTFSDDLEQNSNSHSALTQDDATDFLYEWDQNITSSSASQRAGMHFFCDNPTLPNRGNSYFVYLRESDNLVQIYRVTSDVFQLYANDTLTIDNNTWYNCKVRYSPTSGDIKLYVNGQLTTQWQDPTPLITGNSVSLRTGGCEASFDNFHVYRSRGNQITVPAGTSESMAFESDGGQETGRVHSIVLDSANNWSLIAMEEYLLDFTAPSLNGLADGPAADIDTFWTSTLEANWNIVDVHSGIDEYEVAIGTLPNLDDVAPWSTNGLTASLSYVLASPIIDEVYHVSVRATNQAGLETTFTSNGQRYVIPDSTAGLDALFAQITIAPNPANQFIVIDHLPGTIDLQMYDGQGRLCYETRANESVKVDLINFSNGVYQLILRQGNAFVVKRIVVHH
jgi:hypothetical protein